jgi:hypothetical protein
LAEAEIYYQEAMNTHKWGKKVHKPDVHYAFKTTTTNGEWTKVEKEKPDTRTYEDTIKALTA